MVCAAILGLLSSNEHNMVYGLLLLIALLLLLWQKRKIAGETTSDTKHPKTCPNSGKDTSTSEMTQEASPSGVDHDPIEPPKKPMPIAAKHRDLTPDGQEPSGLKPVDEKISYFEKYLGVIEEKHGVAAKERLRSDVEDLFGSSPKSADNKNGRIVELLEECKTEGRAQKVNGLVVGRVQSGKTQNYIGLMLKAIDGGYNLILILTSNNVALGAQTRNRVVAEFEGVGLTREKFNLISDFPREARGRNLPAVDGERVTVCFALKEKNHLGSTDNSVGVHGWLKGNKDALKSTRMLIIDDEADSYTQNTNANLTKYWDYSDLMKCAEDIEAEPELECADVAEWVENIAKNGFRTDDPMFKALKKEVSEWGSQSRENFVSRILSANSKGEDSKFLHVLRLDEKRGFPKLNGFVENYFTRPKWGRRICGGAADYYDAFFYILKYGCDIKPERSTINRAICGIVDDYAYQKLVYVGYTATPYANVLNERFGAGNPLEPAFVQSLTISPNYLGLERIFGSCWEAAEGTESLSPFVVPCEDGSIEDAMDQSLAWTFCCAAMRAAIREEFNDERRDSRAWRWTTMMVNLSSRIDEHTSQGGKMQKLVNDKLADREEFKSECLAVFDSLQSKGISAEVFKKTFPDYDGAVRELDRSIVEKKIADLIDRRHVDVLVLNGASENVGNYDRYVQAEEYIKKNPNEKISDDHVWIVVGGNKLSRGLTFDGLVTSVFDRESPAVCVDTLTQMGRWFGYRTNYELMPRIWMPKVTASEFKKIADLERDWHSRVKDMFDKREPVKELRFMDIGRDMSGHSAAQMRDGGENPLIVNEYRVGEDTLKEAMAGLNDFLQNLGKEMDRPSAEYGEWYDKWHCWRGVSDARVRDYVKKAQERLSPRLEKRVAHFMDEDLSAEKVFDVVLENPDSKGRTISSAQGLKEGYEIHVMGASDIHFIGQDFVAAEKFHGQYDALKAVVPKAVLDVIQERHPGSKLNDSEAFKEIFEEVERRGLPVNPILRIGFINGPGELADGQPIVTLSIYWPLHDRRPYREPSTIQTAQRSPITSCGTPIVEEKKTAVGKMPAIRQTEGRSSGAVNARGSKTAEKPCKNPPVDGLTEEKKKELLKALNALANKPCPWYRLRQLKGSEPGDFWEMEEIKRLGFGPDDEGAVIQFVTENGWRMEKSEHRHPWYVLAPTSFAEQGGIVAAVREKYIDCAKEALKESLKNKGKGAKLTGMQLRQNTASCWNKKGYPSVDEKIDSILPDHKTIPYSITPECEHNKQGAQDQAAAISRLRNRGFVVEQKGGKWSYGLAEETADVQKANIQDPSHAPARDSREGDSMEALIRELINGDDGIIAEPKLKEMALLKPGVKVADYERAILSFKDKAINKGMKPEDTPLSEHDIFVSLEKLEDFEQVIRLQSTNYDEYLRQLNDWLVKRVDEEVKACRRAGGGIMDLAEFIQLLQDKFPYVFSSQGIKEFFWDRYAERIGIVDDPEGDENDF